MSEYVILECGQNNILKITWVTTFYDAFTAKEFNCCMD